MTEAERLRALLDACHDVLPHLDDGAMADKVRETCRALEQRLDGLTTPSEATG